MPSREREREGERERELLTVTIQSCRAVILIHTQHKGTTAAARVSKARRRP
jgi:hypothetical protein